MTTTPLPSITDDQLAEIEALALLPTKGGWATYGYYTQRRGNTMTTEQLMARLEQLLRERAERKKEKEND